MIELDDANHLVSFGATSPVDEVARACAARGMFFPGPVGAFTGVELVRACPLFTDAFVARASFRAAGVEGRTALAPRAAVGPDLTGALINGAAEPVRLTVRCFDSVRVGLVEEDLSSTAAAAERVSAAVARGRSFLIAARSTHVVEIGARGVGLPDVWHRFVTVERPAGTSLNPADQTTLATQLDAGFTVLAAPFIGRAGVTGGAAPASQPGTAALIAAMRGEA